MKTPHGKSNADEKMANDLGNENGAERLGLV